MKKLVSLALALIMSTAVLAGCGGGKDSAPANSANTEKQEEAVDSDNGATADSGSDAQATSDGEQLKVVYIGSRLGDNSTSDAIWDGMQRASADFDAEVRMIEIHPTDNSKYKAAVLEAADSDAQLIIGSAGSGLIDDLIAVAYDYPEKDFMCLDAPIDQAEIPELPNFVGMMCKQNECSYLVGYLAGKMTTSNKIGGIVGVEYPVLQDFLVGYISGAKASNPDIQVATAAIGDFVDTAKSKEIALAQYRSGCDIVFAIAGPASYGIIEAGAESDQMVIGVDVDMTLSVNEEQAKHILTSAIKDWGYLSYHMIERYAQDKSTIGWSTVEVYGIANGGATFIQNDVYTSLVPQEIQDEMNQLVEDVKAGSITIPSVFDMSEDEYAALKESVKLQ